MYNCTFCTALVAKYLTTSIKWYNELGSVMTITSVDLAKGNFSGTYCSAVGEAEKEYGLQGRFDNEGSTLGWTVAYKNAHMNARSTASWSGQFQLDLKTNQPTILTTWALTSQTKPEDDWSSTNVGFDTFTMEKPTEDIILRAKLRCQKSHPKKAE